MGHNAFSAPARYTGRLQRFLRPLTGFRDKMGAEWKEAKQLSAVHFCLSRETKMNLLRLGLTPEQKFWPLPWSGRDCVEIGWLMSDTDQLQQPVTC